MAEAIRIANADRPREDETYDFREAETIERLEPPKPRILADSPRTGTDSNQFVLRTSVSSENDLPVLEVKVLVNGRPAARPVRLESSESSEGAVVLETPLQLPPGRNQVAVIASNSQSTSEPEVIEIDVASDGQTTVKPDLYLLSIGVGDYADSSLNLQFPAADARQFAASIDRQAGQFCTAAWKSACCSMRRPNVGRSSMGSIGC